MRILFVGMENSIHTARWINQISDQGWDIHLFPVDGFAPSAELRNITVYGLALWRPKYLHKSVRYVGLLPIGRGGKIVQRLFYRAFPQLWEYALELVFRMIKPDLVHSLEFQHGAYMTLPVMQKARRRLAATPKWIATNWGSDIYLFGRLAGHRERVRQVLEQCDFYSCECQRDVFLAQQAGLKGQVLPVFPNTGGFDLQELASLHKTRPTSARRTILLKGYQNWAGRALVGLRALARCAAELKAGGYAVAIYLAGEEVSIAAEVFELETGIPTVLIPPCSHREMLEWFGKSRLYIGLSISDAISTSLLEAMAMGAFPIQSCTACADEWILDGESGLIVPPEDPDLIAGAIQRALRQDELVDRAAEINLQTTLERLDSSKIKPQVIALYEEVFRQGQDEPL
jgi:glycosyltransferase involved in cell wall biosynthesis